MYVSNLTFNGKTWTLSVFGKRQIKVRIVQKLYMKAQSERQKH